MGKTAATTCRRTRRTGFSLVELVIVVVLIGVIAAIAVPRMSRGTEGSADTAMARDVAVLQRALDHYAAEHGGAFPAADKVADQLTLFTDAAGAVSKQKTPPFTFGPYVNRIPVMPKGPNRGSTKIAATAAPGVAWVYDPADGAVTANLGNGVPSGSAATGSPTTAPVD